MRRLNVKLFVILLCSFAVLAGVTVVVHRLQAGNIASALLYQADQAEADGRNDQAARFLGRYLEFEPQDLEQRARLGAFLSERKLIATPRGQKRARFVLEQVLARSPEDHASRLALVRVALQARWEELAKDHLEHLEKALPESADVVELRAIWQEQKGMDAPASESYRKAIALAPDSVDAHVRLARVLRRLEMGRPRAHRAELDQLVGKALALAPENADVLALASERALDEEDADAARAYLKKGHELYPRQARFHLGLARMEEKAGRQDEALAILQSGLETLPKTRHFELRWAQANLHLDAGHLDKARAATVRLQDFPGTETARLYLKARILMQQNLWFEAARAFERVEPGMKSSPELALQVALYLGICYEQLNEPAKQLAAYRKVVELDPLSTAGRRGVAMAHWALGATDNAVRALRENAALAADPRDPARHRVELARMLLLSELKKEKRSWGAIERELDAAQKEDPDHLEGFILRAELLHHQGKSQQARELLHNAKEKHPKRAELWLISAALAERVEDVAEVERILLEAPDSAEVRLARARHWARQGGPVVEKLQSLESGIQKLDDEEKARLLHGLGVAYFQAGQPAEAQRLWWRITELPRHVSNVRVRFLLLDLAIQQGDEPAMQRVLADLKKLESDPGEGGAALYRFGVALHQLWQARGGKQDLARSAKKLLLEVEAERPLWDAVALARAEADEILGNLDLAIRHYRKAIELGMRGDDITRKLVVLLSQTHRFDEAEKEIAHLQKRAPLSDEVQRLAVAISMQRDDFAKAEQLIRQAMADKKDWRDHLWLGQVLAGDGRIDEAEKELRAALDMESKQPEPYVALVRLQVRAGKTDQTEALLEALKTNVPAKQHDLALAQCHEILGQFEQAQKHLARALEVQPESGVLHKMHAAFLLRTGKAAQAEPILRRLAASDNAEDVAWARRSLSLVLVASGDAKNAREAMQVVGVELDAEGRISHESATDSAEELLARAKVLALQQRKPLRGRAIALMEELQKTNSLAPEDQFLLAQLYVNQGPEPVWWGKARDILIGLVKSYPRHPQFLLVFAQHALRNKDLVEADRMTTKLEQVEKSRGLTPGELGSIEMRARVLEASGNSKKALGLIQDHARAPGAPPERGFMVAALQARMGKLGEAVETCLAVDTSMENRARALMGILRRFHGGSHLAKNKNLWSEQADKVESVLKNAITAQPDALMLRLHLADLLDLLGRYDEVEVVCRDVLDRDPNHLTALNNLAWLLAQRKTQPDEALKLITRAIDRYGPRPELLDTRAVVYLTLGRSETALADLKRATADAPTAAKYFNLARAHHLMRDTKSARQALSQATALGLDDRRLHPTEREIYRQVTAELKR